jgi:hypothetical protein
VLGGLASGIDNRLDLIGVDDTGDVGVAQDGMRKAAPSAHGK